MLPVAPPGGVPLSSPVLSVAGTPMPPNEPVLLALPPTAASASVLRTLRSEGVSVNPVSDGIAVLDAVRSEAPNVPVIAVTPRERRAGLLAQLRGDRDDYLLRPFAVDELAARIRLRLRLGPVSGTTMLRHGEVTVDTEFGEVHVDGRRVALSPTEFSVLLALVAEGGSVVPADRLARQAWSEPVSANLVQVYISYLRRKIGPERIRTVRGGGYALEA